jgi:hypothetical protein|tara:strand:+ start:1919 stop:2038 length:120 start_codon:yes stop_codon:yes gene_type:complete
MIGSEKGIYKKIMGRHKKAGRVKHPTGFNFKLSDQTILI